MSAFNATPFGQAHLCLPPGASKQRWLQPPFCTRQGGLSTAEAEKNEIMSVCEGSIHILIHFSCYDRILLSCIIHPPLISTILVKLSRYEQFLTFRNIAEEAKNCLFFESSQRQRRTNRTKVSTSFAFHILVKATFESSLFQKRYFWQAIQLKSVFSAM